MFNFFGRRSASIELLVSLNFKGLRICIMLLIIRKMSVVVLTEFADTLDCLLAAFQPSGFRTMRATPCRPLPSTFHSFELFAWIDLEAFVHLPERSRMPKRMGRYDRDPSAFARELDGDVEA